MAPCRLRFSIRTDEARPDIALVAGPTFRQTVAMGVSELQGIINWLIEGTHSSEPARNDSADLRAAGRGRTAAMARRHLHPHAAARHLRPQLDLRKKHIIDPPLDDRSRITLRMFNPVSRLGVDLGQVGSATWLDYGFRRTRRKF